MSASFIGSRVELKLRGGHDLQGMIDYVDTNNGSLAVRLDEGRGLIIPRQDILDLKILSSAPQPHQQQPQQPQLASVTMVQQQPQQPQLASVTMVQQPQKQQDAGPSSVPFQAPIALPTDTNTDSAPRTSKSSIGPVQILTKQSSLQNASVGSASPKPSRQRAKTPDMVGARADASSGKSSRRQRKKDARPTSSPAPGKAHTDDEESDLDQDFDFDKALKSFDKKKIWEEIKTSDRSDPRMLLVAHNRKAQHASLANGEGRDAQEKLAWNEPVLSPSPPPAEERKQGTSAQAPALEATPQDAQVKQATGSANGTVGLEKELSRLQTSSLQRDVEASSLRSEVQRLRARVAVLEALAGAEVEATTSQSGEAKGEASWRVSVYENVAMHKEARRKQRQEPGKGVDAAKGAITFGLSTESSDGQGSAAKSECVLLKLRYLGVDASRSDAAILDRMPAQYKQQMGLKPESASVFFRRLKDAVQGHDAAS